MKLVDFYIIFAILFLVYLSYLLYQLWLEPKKVLKRYRNSYYKLPKWYPLRGIAIGWVNDEKSWISVNKILGIFAEIFCIVFLILILIARFSGK